MRSRMLLLGLLISTLGFAAPSRRMQPVHRVNAIEPSPAPAIVAGAPAPDELVEAASLALLPLVKKQSDRNAVRLGLHAYYAYQAAHPDESTNPYFYFVDYGLDNRTPRGYVFDMHDLKLVDGPFLVAHGRGSSRTRDGIPTRFSNAAGSAATSLGLYRAKETYAFSGHASGRLYSSIGLRMDGLSGAFNSSARARGVVIHGAPYFGATGAGRSEGCPSMEQARARRLIPLLANGALVFLYSPRDPRWLREDPWANMAD